ncbi:hypothetical protein PLESTM_000387200 [Pleodorina starrii]|nr:hypothetical protein PLESTM_000387200 [Pleodorina starrii]
MKRRSRGEQMLAAAGLAVAKPAQPAQASDANEDDAKSPPAKRARSTVKDTAPCRNSQRAEQNLQKPAADSVFKLPADLELLASMFDAVRTGRMMLKRRSEKVTYNSVRHVVENMTKREFRVEHLAQMKYLRPQSFDWQYIRTPSASNPLQMEMQLLLTFDRPTSSGADGGGGGSVGKYSGASDLAEFRLALEQYAKANPVDPETGNLPPVPQATLPLRPTASGLAATRSGSLQLGALPSPSTSAGVGAGVGSSGGLRHAASCPPEMLPELQLPGALSGLGSPDGSQSSGLSGASPAMTRSRSRLGLPPPGPLPPSLTPIPEGGTPAAAHKTATAAAQQLQKQHVSLGSESGRQSTGGPEQEGEVELEEDQDVGPLRGQTAAVEGPVLELTQQRDASVTSGSLLGGGMAMTAAAATPQSKLPRPAPLQTTPSSHQRQAGDGKLARLHSLLSPAAMQKILQAEALLPHGHELVRLIFGLQGPTVKPLTQVAQLMCERSTQRQGLNARDASNALVALTRAAPEFLRIEEPRVMADGSARPRSVVISRAANINAVAAKLKALAADPDAAVTSIFERSGAADAAARDESPGRGAAPAGGPGPVPGSPAAQLRPRALAMSLEGEAAAGPGGGSSAAVSVGGRGSGSESAAAGSVVDARGPGSLLAAEGPPPTPSSRRRPPGLPLAPPSPMVARCGQTPTRSARLAAAASGGSILAAHAAGVSGTGPAATATASCSAAVAPAAAAGAGEFLQKLCRTAAPAGGKSTLPASKGDGDGSSALGAGEGVPQGGGAEVGRSGEGAEASGCTPGRTAAGGRTPGRTAVQEVMLNSIRRSSAKRSCRKMLDEELGVGQGGDDEAEPVPRRLEESLME